MNKNELTPDEVLSNFEKLELKERALSLACRYFENPTDDHIDGIFSRLGWNLLRGEAEHGVVTIH